MYIFIDNTTFYFTSERKKIMKLNSEFVFFLKKLLGRENSVPIFSIYIIWKVFQISFWKFNVEFFLIICNSLCITNDDTNERCFIKCTINNVSHVSLIWILHRHNLFYWLSFCMLKKDIKEISHYFYLFLITICLITM